MIKLNSKKLLESETPSCGFDKVGLKGGQNSSKSPKSVYAWFSLKWVRKFSFKLKVKKIASLRPLLDQP